MMHRRPERDERGEKGAALVIALVFLSLFGVLIAEQLSESAVNFQTTAVVRSRSAKLYAADGALNTAVQLARTNDSYCPNPAASFAFFSTPTLNAHASSVACLALSGAVANPAAQQWAVITTSPLPTSLITVGTSAADSVVGGDVFINGGLNLAANLSVNDGDVLQRASACAGLTQPLKIAIAVPDLWSCTTAATPPLPTVVLPPAPTVPRDNPISNFPCNGSPWTIFHPGLYTSANLSQADFGLFNFFESGVYYFQDVAVDFGSRVIIGGQPQAPEAAVLAPGCPTDASAGAASRASGKGVIFVLGGSSTIRIGNSLNFTQTELFSRVPASGDSSTPGLSIVAAYAGNPYGYAPSTALSSFADATGGGDYVAIHGLVYSPTVPVTIEASGINAPLLGGVVASTLTVLQPLGAAGTLLAVAATGRRTLLFTSSAAGTAPGEIATVENAVVKIANDPARTATVRSWRAT